jgi:hypothetical protein
MNKSIQELHNIDTATLLEDRKTKASTRARRDGTGARKDTYSKQRHVRQIVFDEIIYEAMM